MSSTGPDRLLHQQNGTTDLKCARDKLTPPPTPIDRPRDTEHIEDIHKQNEKDSVHPETRAETPWLLHDTPIENQRPMKVIVIGAGYSGVYLGIRIPERLRNCELVIYEKNSGVGGTWWENSYPGAACE